MGTTTYKIPFTAFKRSGKYYTDDYVEVEVPEKLVEQDLWGFLHMGGLADALHGKYPDMYIVVNAESVDDIIGWPYMRPPEANAG